jgi:hypothetical protein
LNGAGPKGPGSFIPTVGVLSQEGPENKKIYKHATNFYREHPEEDCKQAIESLDPAGSL